MFTVLNMKQSVAIYGAGALAKQIINYNQRYDMFDLVALIDDNACDGQTFMGYNVFSFDKFLGVYGDVYGGGGGGG